MSKASDAANAMVYAAQQVCGLYGVAVTRIQSRTFNVPGAAGRWRPLFVGEWVDNFGHKHRKGMADLLARPRIPARCLCNAACEGIGGSTLLTVPLWIELKSGKGRLDADQIAFKNYVEANGETYLLLHDEVDSLVQWFQRRGVEKQFDSVIPTQPHHGLAVEQLHALPCRHCGQLRAEHIGVALGCPNASAKVWSPKLRS